jgi:hypothetical protein
MRLRGWKDLGREWVWWTSSGGLVTDSLTVTRREPSRSTAPGSHVPHLHWGTGPGGMGCQCLPTDPAGQHSQAGEAPVTLLPMSLLVVPVTEALGARRSNQTDRVRGKDQRERSRSLFPVRPDRGEQKGRSRKKSGAKTPPQAIAWVRTSLAFRSSRKVPVSPTGRGLLGRQDPLGVWVGPGGLSFTPLRSQRHYAARPDRPTRPQLSPSFTLSTRPGIRSPGGSAVSSAWPGARQEQRMMTRNRAPAGLLKRPAIASTPLSRHAAAAVSCDS